MTVTTLQAEMIRRIARNEMTPINGAEPETAEDTETWASEVIETAEDKGVFTSLVNAGLAMHRGSKRDASVRLTAAGLAVYRSLS